MSVPGNAFVYTPEKCVCVIAFVGPQGVFDKEQIYWVGPKVRSGYSVTSYGKTQTNFWANPIFPSNINSL